MLIDSLESSRRDLVAPSAPHRSTAARGARIWFWIKRYGAAEVACLVTMLAASIAAGMVTDSPPLLAIAAIAGATVGFYGVLATTVLREQLRVVPRSRGRWLRVTRRTAGLLTAEFGVAEIADTFVLRPALMIAGVQLVGHAVWGLLLGKFVADILFYVVSALCFRITERTGLRLPRRVREPAAAAAG